MKIACLYMLLFFSFIGYSQNLTLEPIISYRILKSSNNDFLADSITLRTNSPNDIEFSFGLKLIYGFGKNVSLSSGVETFQTFRGFLIYGDKDCFLCPVMKSGYFTTRTLTFPQLMLLTLFRNDKLRLSLIAGITPNINIGSSTYKVQPNSSFPHGVADVINSLTTMKKTLIFDYSVGGKIQLGRINLYFQYQDNLSHSTLDPLEVWGNSYKFYRREWQYVISLSYVIKSWNFSNSK